MLSGELSVETGGSVDVRYTVENTGEESVELTFRDGGHADCVVLDGDSEVWRWSEGRMFTMAMGHETVAPGDSLAFEFEWTPSTTGEYTVRGELRADEEDCRAERTISVESVE
ncbi:BsuPI-related putative proteinase inhibitor [Halomarina oriensis]|uniref:Intracellular proteinase inhibitor BsuPI domain-containing protein n=1 Tax=Halomarina oriensis TaxID=671145 RepID=A0A6B0GT48_9EURY|nr:BsuPI-related putative proteinase inhibitor [Halomarina oriensis]MWG35853.1 hypothetical protein [Halomarina oriensis]